MITVDELRTALINKGMDESIVAGMRKSELKVALENILADEANDVMEFNFEKMDSESHSESETLEEAIGAKYGSDEWGDFVLSKFTKDELVDGCPKCNGLRRVAQLLLGNIVESRAISVIVTPSEPRCVTVNYNVAIDWKLDTPVGFGNIDNLHDVRSFGGLADCVEENTVFGKHPAATAESKAEARALRKALGINILTAEEKLSGESNSLPQVDSSSKITTALARVIIAKTNALKISVNEVAKACFGETKVLEDCTMKEAQELFDFINNYQRH